MWNTASLSFHKVLPEEVAVQVVAKAEGPDHHPHAQGDDGAALEAVFYPHTVRELLTLTSVYCYLLDFLLFFAT